MAGPHQIWLYDPDENKVGVFAGSGAEARVDGTLAESAFAQPSGLTTDGAYLFVADSETSSIRQIDIMEGEVTTLAGLDLFEFGDVDGTGETVRLQHPLGIEYGDDALYIADTYNSKIKRLDLSTGTVRTIAGTGTAGNMDSANGAATAVGALYEPGGLSLTGNTLYIADTNNHAIRCLDLTTGLLSTLAITESHSTTPATSFSPRSKQCPHQRKPLRRMSWQRSLLHSRYHRSITLTLKRRTGSICAWTGRRSSSPRRPSPTMWLQYRLGHSRQARTTCNTPSRCTTAARAMKQRACSAPCNGECL